MLPAHLLAWARSKSNRDHCSDSELCCLWTNQADAFQGMNLNSLPDWSRAIGPIPSISAITPEPRVNKDLAWSSMLVAAGGTRLQSPRGPFCPHSKQNYLICCNMSLGCLRLISSAADSAGTSEADSPSQQSSHSVQTCTRPSFKDCFAN